MCAYIYIYRYLLKQLSTSWMGHKLNCKAKFNGFQFRVFLFLNRLPYQCERAQVYPAILPIVVGRIAAFILIPRIFASSEMQTTSIWIWVTMSISYDCNHYTINTTWYTYIYIYIPSSSCVECTKFSDFLLLSVFISRQSWQVPKMAFNVRTELIYVSKCLPVGQLWCTDLYESIG